jgi:peptidase, M23/M37 family
MRAFWLLFAFVFSLYAADTKKEISKTISKISEKEKLENELNKKVEQIGNSVKMGLGEIDKTSKKLDELSNSINDLSKNAADKTQELKTLNAKNVSLLNMQKELEDKITDLISNEFSLEILQNSNEIATTESVMRGAIFDNLNSILNDDMAKILSEYGKIQSQILLHQTKIAQIETNLANLDSKKIEFEATKKRQIQNVENLEKDKERYIRQLEDIHAQQEALNKTLQDLKIIDDKQEREKAKAEEERRLAELEKKKEQKKQSPKSQNIKDEKIDFSEDEEPQIKDERVANINKKIKQYGSSYQESRVAKYHGARTIAPLENAYVKRKFGNYTDPVYNIKIFNESIVLGTKSDNSQVKNVLNGEVVFVNETAVLGKVIIVKHTGNIHTIYAHLSQIAPTIKVGSIIKKGYVIGRISGDLTFEVTQANHHINPLELITL